MQNLYEFLKIPETLTLEEIELAFINFKNGLKKFSPGINVSDIELRLRQPEIWDAYLILLNPVSKKEHDELLARLREDKLKETERIIEQQQIKSSDKWKYFGLGSFAVLLVAYFLFQNHSVSNLTEEPKWRSHHITDEIQVILPGPIDTNVNFIPPYLLNYVRSYSSFESVLKGGFSVSVARFDMYDNFKISENDISYIVNTEMGSHMATHRPDSTNYTINIRGYRVFVRKGSYVVEGTLRAFENYSMLKGNTAIKIIVAFVPGDEKQIKYAETVFNSLQCF